MQPQPAVVVPQSYVVANTDSTLSVGVKATRGLGITRIVIGSITTLLGILTLTLLEYWAAYVGFAIWSGLWIFIGGLLGVFSAAKPSNRALNWTNMSFAIVSICIMAVDFIVYFIAVTKMQYLNQSCTYVYYSDCHSTPNTTGLALYSVLLILSFAEFSFALSVAICCCKYGCIGCGEEDTTAIVLQQPHIVPSSVVVQSTAQTSYPGGVYPASSYPAASYPAASYPAASYPAASYPAVSYPAASYPVASYPCAFGSTASPAYNGFQQGTYTNAGYTAVPQSSAMTYNQGGPNEKQGGPPPYQ